MLAFMTMMMMLPEVPNVKQKVCLVCKWTLILINLLQVWLIPCLAEPNTQKMLLNEK